MRISYLIFLVFIAYIFAVQRLYSFETVPGSPELGMVLKQISHLNFSSARPPSHETHPSDGVLPPSHPAGLQPSTGFVHSRARLSGPNQT